MASWGKERNKPTLRMPVRVGVNRHTMGHLQNGGTLHTTLPAPRNVVKTPQGLKLVPAKRNILGQCLVKSPSYPGGLSSQAKVPVQRKLPRPVYNTRVQALMLDDDNQNLHGASNVRPIISSPLVPLEEYEKHHKDRANIGIFKDFETFRTLPEPRTEKVPILSSNTRLAQEKSGVLASKRKRYTASKYKNTYSLKSAGVKKVSEILHQPSRLTLIPKSPHIIMYNTRKDPLKTSTLSLTPATHTKKHGNFFLKSSVLDIPSICNTNSNNLGLKYEEKPALLPSDSHLEELNESLSRPVEQLNGNDENKSPHLEGVMKHDQPCNGSSANNAQTCNLFVPMPPVLADCKPNESHTTHSSCDLHGMYSCVYPVIEMEQKHISLLKEQCDLKREEADLQKQQADLQKQQADLQKQLSDVQQKELNCLKKMLELREENAKLLHAQSARITQVNIVEIIPITTEPEIITEPPVSSRRRRSARLAIQSKSEEEESHFVATANTNTSVIDIHTQLSLTKDTDSTKNDLKITRNSSTKKRDTHRKLAMNYYGGLRSSFKDLLQTPQETPGPGKSAKKVQFTVQDTPARLSSNIMKQLNSLYDS